MKIHLIASAYQAGDAYPCLIVSYQQFNELMKNGFPGLEFLVVGRTAEEAELNIFKSFGFETSPSQELKKAKAQLTEAREVILDICEIRKFIIRQGNQDFVIEANISSQKQREWLERNPK